MKRKMIATVLIASMCMATACSGEGDRSEDRRINDVDPDDIEYEELIELDAGYDDDEVNDAYKEFIFNIFSACSDNEKGNANYMISPASIMMALEIANAGASGDTQDQITEMLFPGVGTNEGLTFAADLMDRINNSNGVEFHAANSIWLNEDHILDYINQDYIDYCMDNFDAEIVNAPFNNVTVDDINDWVSDKTDGMIPELLDDLNPDTVAVILNAIAFDGEWATPFEDYQVNENGIFTNANGEQEQVTMLSDTLYRYFETDKARGFMKCYSEGEYAFVGILPNDESISANEFASSFTAEDYEEFWNSLDDTLDVNILMPEFTSDYNVDLNDIVSELGMTEAFDEDNADFSLMAQIPDANIFVSRIIHKTHIEVDRNGTRAAAATAVMEDAASCAEPVPSVNVYLDRPFVYMIVDTETGTPVFMGTVNSVNG
ncbi:MAG: serpin family protein [Clostridiales bacterium]|nr:serpin family protein [Clostridiales bacterium]